MRLRRVPLWAEVVAGLVVWTMAASAIVLWILPVPGVSPWAAGVATGSAADSANWAAAGPSSAAKTLAAYPRPAVLAWSAEASAALGQEAVFGAYGAVITPEPAVETDGITIHMAYPTEYSEDLRGTLTGWDTTSGKNRWTFAETPREGALVACASTVLNGRIPCLLSPPADYSKRAMTFVDVKTGRPDSTVELAGGRFDSIAVIEGDVVVAGYGEADGSQSAFDIRRIRVEGGEVWKSVTPLEADEAENEDSPIHELSVTSGRVAFATSVSGRLLDGATGTQLPLTERVGLLTDGTAIGYGRADRGESPTKQGISVIGPGETSVRWTNPREANRVPDASIESGIVLDIDGEGVVTGTSLSDGTRKWNTSALGTDLSVCLWSGHTIVLCSYSLQGLTAIDDRSGETTWVSDAPAQVGVGVSDGTTGYVAGEDELVAVDLAHGNVRWRTDLPGPAPQADSGQRQGNLGVVDGKLFYSGFSTIALFAP